MRVLLVDETDAATGLHDELARIHDVRVAGSLDEAMAFAGQDGWQPDAIVADPATGEIEALRRGLGEVPLVFAGSDERATLRLVTALSANATPPSDGLLRRVLAENRALQRTMATSRGEVLAEIDVVARRAAEQAVQQAVDRLMVRLGLDDDEGVRRAIRLARAYEEARSRFWSAITTGLASGLLVALAWGIWAVLNRADLTPTR